MSYEFHTMSPLPLAYMFTLLWPFSLSIRPVDDLEIQISSCSAKDVMQHTIATVCTLHTRWIFIPCFFLFYIILRWKGFVCIIYFLVQNVSSGPYLCPKHTRCHSCNSSVPGNGLSVRYVVLSTLWSFVKDDTVSIGWIIWMF